MISTFLALLLAVTLPEGGTPVLPADAFTSMRPVANNYGTLTQVKPTDADSRQLNIGEALRCEIKNSPPNPWDCQFQFKVDRKIEKNEVLLARFYARAVTTSNEAGDAIIRPIFEKNGPPHDKSLSQDLEIGREWKEYFLPFKSLEAYPAGGTTTGFHLGFRNQTVEIAGFALYSYGLEFDIRKLPRTGGGYKGQEPDAAWRKEAEKRIEKIRKGDLSVTVRDAGGRPITGATVEVRMKRHAFGWGSAVVAGRILEEGRNGDRYREVIEKYFTRVVFENDLKWHSWDNPKNHEKILKATRWLRDRNIEIRGHCLVWPSWKHVPKDLEGLAGNPDALRQRINEHIKSEVTAMKGLLVDWDVINEPYTNFDIMKVLGDDEMVAWFKLARQYDPDVNLYLNDYSILSGAGLDVRHQDHFEKTLRFLKEKGAPITGLGMQSHFSGTATPPERMLEILDRFAKLGLDISITEHDINSNDEDFQADFTRDFLITTFSHPSVVAILGWGFWENSHWKPSAAYFRSDWSITPAGQAWIDLVTKRWWTQEDGRTDATGKFATRGFLGDYEITVRQGQQVKTVKVAIPKEGTRLDIALP